MSTRTWEWRDDERAQSLINDIKEYQHWVNVCQDEGNDEEAWHYAMQRGAAIATIRTLFGVKKADEIERMTRKGREG